MKHLAQLLNRLFFTYSHHEKVQLLQEYFAKTPDPERGFGVAIIAGVINFKYFKRRMIQTLLEEYMDPVLFSLSWDYVGDFAETASLLWPNTLPRTENIPRLSEIISTLSSLDKQALPQYLKYLFDIATPNERWAIIKMTTYDLRIGISQRFLKQALAAYGHKDIQIIEEIWHALTPPYIELFAWLENRAEKPDVMDALYFHPIMLSHPLLDTELEKIHPDHFAAEWKYDGIRVQLVSTHMGKRLFSRSGDDISNAFPDILAHMDFHAVLDGELVIQTDQGILSFNDLQQRLNRKKPSAKMLTTFPAHVVVYDILSMDHHDLRPLAFSERRNYLEDWFQKGNRRRLSLSALLSFTDETSLKILKQQITRLHHANIEGLMFKRKTSPYIPGRPIGHWYKWKRNPYLIDAVLMYAQRGQGKRRSYYSDFTFGLWQEGKLLTIGKAYFGFTDEELYELDKWVRRNTIKKFGPVREVAKQLVLEIAFDAIQLSSRHKSGYALRFPRINRIRWDKPADEADTITNLAKLFKN